MRHRKGKREGFEERKNLLSEAFEEFSVPTTRQEAGHTAPPTRADDVLDAIVATWTARRFAEAGSGRFPSELPRDLRGLRMEIVY